MQAFICISSVNENFKVGKIYYYEVRNNWPWIAGENAVYHAHPSKLVSAKFKSALEAYVEQAIQIL